MKAAKVRTMSASKAGALVLYSFGQSASTPRRLNWAVWVAIHDSEKASHRARISAVVSVSFSSRISRETFCSIGRPWQSHPGTKGVRKPRIVL